MLGPGASAFLSDATFADFSLDLTVSGAAAPWVVLRDESGRESEIGGPACPLATPAKGKLHLERHGAAVTARADDAAALPCPPLASSAARLTIGVRGGPQSGAVRGLRVDRL